MPDNPLLSAWLKAGFVWVITLTATWLITHKLLTVEMNDATKAQIDLLASGLVTFCYQAYVKLKDRRKLATALASPHTLTEKQVEAKIANGEGAPASTPKDEVPEASQPIPPNV